MSETKRIMISTPVYWYDEPEGRYNRFQLARHTVAQGYDIHMPDLRQDSLVNRARDCQLKEFLERGPFDWLFTIDNDIICPPDTLVRLLNRGKDFIGALYRKKNYYRSECASVGLNRNIEPDPTGLAQMHYLSAGCCLVHVRVIMDMIETYPELKYNHHEQGQCFGLYLPMLVEDPVIHPGGGQMLLSEDWAFCYRAKQMGVKLWADCNIPIGHIMPTPLYLENTLAAKDIVTNMDGIALERPN